MDLKLLAKYLKCIKFGNHACKREEREKVARLFD